MNTAAALDADFAFAEESAEFTSAAPLLRYVAAINHDVTRVEFVAAAVRAGYKEHAATARFHESRRVDLSSEPDCLRQSADGRLYYIDPLALELAA